MATNKSLDRKSLVKALNSLMMSAARLHDRDLSLTAAGTMDTLDRMGPRRITQLAASEGIAQPSMTALVTGLEQAGLVERRKDPSDLRVVLVALTSKGHKYMNGRRNHIANHFAEWIDELSDDEIETLWEARDALRHLGELSAEYYFQVVK